MRLREVIASTAAKLFLAVCLLRAAATTYTYDSLSRLTAVTYPDGTTISYTYDAAGNRLSQVIVNPSVLPPKLAVDKTTLTFSAAAGQTPASQSISVTNTGGGTLQWAASSSANWLTVTPASGTNSGAVSVTASAAGISAGTYNASITILAAASNASVTIPVVFTVTAARGNPSISSGGIVSAAGSSPGLARGSVATLYGASLADGTSTATTAPLPKTLGNTQVSVNGVSAPLWYADSGQINFQVPFESPLQGQASVVVTHNGVASAPMSATLTPYAPSVFTYQRTAGVFDPIIVHATSNQLVTPTAPAVPGEYLVVYGTGIGDLTVVPATDAFSPSGPLAAAKVTPTATVGGVTAPVSFAGLTPGAIGLAQFNVQVPGSLPSGSSLPLVINFNGAASAPVNLYVQAGKPTANLNLVFTPNPAHESSLSSWTYSVQLQETSGVGVTLTKMFTSGTDSSGLISALFGSNRVEANGQLKGTITTSCGTPCGPPYSYVWQLTGNDDNGHSGLTWTGTVQLLPPQSSAVAGYTIDAVAGNRTAGYAGDGGPANASGNLFLENAFSNRVRKVTAAGMITKFAGTGVGCCPGDGSSAATFQGSRCRGMTAPMGVSGPALRWAAWDACRASHVAFEPRQAFA